MSKTIPIRAGYPQPPPQLDAEGRAAWNRGLALWLDGTLQQRDLDAWQAYCAAFDEKKHCETIANRDGEYSLGPNKCYVQHPAIKRRMQAEAVILRYQKLFGLVPDARRKRPAVNQGVASRKR